MQTTAENLSVNVKALMDAVSKGEEVIITYQGKPRAKLVSFEDDPGGEDKLFGIWADHPQFEDVHAQIQTIRKGRIDTK